MSYELTLEPRGIYCKYAGKCSLDELLEAFVSYSERPDFELVRYALHDFSMIESFDFSQESMVNVSAQTVGASFSNSRLVPGIVASHAGVLAAVENYKNLTHRHVEIFANLQEARQWAARR